MPLIFENDEASLEQWNIIDTDTDNRDVVAIVPKTGDEDYDNKYTYPLVKLLTASPDVIEALEIAYGILCETPHVDEWAMDTIKVALKKAGIAVDHGESE